MKYLYNFTKEEFLIKVQELKIKKEVANYFNLSIYLINQFVRENKLNINWKERYKTSNWTFVTKDWLTDNWINTTNSLKQVSIQFNIDLHYLETKAKEFNLVKPYKYQFNKSKMYNVSNANLWYLAGLLATDGYLNPTDNYIEVGLKGKDERELLLKINTYFENQKAPYIFKNDVTRITFSDNKLKQFFKENFNIQSTNKTFTVGVPEKIINEDCAKAYVLGCFDGDGSISKDGYKASLCTASEEFVKGLKNIIETYIPNIYITYGIVKEKYPYIGMTSTNAQKLYSWMYSSNCIFKLERKNKRALKANYEGGDIYE